MRPVVASAWVTPFERSYRLYATPARRVSQLLGDAKWDVTQRIYDDSADPQAGLWLDILSSLHEGRYQVIHIAARTRLGRSGVASVSRIPNSAGAALGACEPPTSSYNALNPTPAINAIDGSQTIK